jgi:hypothetical protein
VPGYMIFNMRCSSLNLFELILIDQFSYFHSVSSVISRVTNFCHGMFVAREVKLLAQEKNFICICICCPLVSMGDWFQDMPSPYQNL